MSDDKEIDYKPLFEQLQGENEELRVRLMQAMKDTPIEKAVDGMVLVIQRSDPMKIYLWVCAACAIALVMVRGFEVFYNRE